MTKRSIRHATDATIELFAAGRLKGEAARRLEMHLLVCDICCAKLEAEDSFGEAVRLVARDVLRTEGICAGFSRIIPRLLQFRTHLPVYSVAAAAGTFGEQQLEIVPEGWIPVPPSSILLTPDMFITHIQGRSMDPVIPDGSLCAFRSQVSAPYEGKIVLLEDYSTAGGNCYFVKRYRTSTRADAFKKDDRTWLHERITLESVNPDFPPLEIASAHQVNVIGEFVFVVV